MRLLNQLRFMECTEMEIYKLFLRAKHLIRIKI